jgi:hypothetical protein
MLREVAADGLLRHKAGSPERGAGWQAVANNLSSSFTSGSEVTSRAVRDHFTIIAKRHQAKVAKEERGTGLGGEELTEKEALLEELVDIRDETESRVEEEAGVRRGNAEVERSQALEMRERAIERYGETRQNWGNTKHHQKRREEVHQKYLVG